MKKCGSIDPQIISVKNKETVLSHLKTDDVTCSKAEGAI